jgi:enterochelin esterase-like enzyme
MFRAPQNRIVALSILLASIPLAAQVTPKPPVVNPDRSVTFTLVAPLAEKVYVGGEFDDKYNRPPGALMTRDEKGVWTYTSQSLDPGLYYYGFVVDNLWIIDPGNTRYRPELRINPNNNVLEVRGDNPFAWEVSPDTPRGTVHVEAFQSTNLNRTVSAYVYTPPSYRAEAGRSYPVLYLLHGNTTGAIPGTASEWTNFGYANRILDNLIASGKAREMIVVMVDSQTPAASATLTALASLELFEKYFVEEVIPFVETRYRAEASKSSRWMAGLSRGGSQTFHVGFRRPDLVSALGAFSIGLPAVFPDAYPLVADAAKLNSQIPLIYYAVGKDDSDQKGPYERGTSMLSQSGIRYETGSEFGGHIWEVWRNSLTELLTRLR